MLAIPKSFIIIANTRKGVKQSAYTAAAFDLAVTSGKSPLEAQKQSQYTCYMAKNIIRERKDIADCDKWDLTTLFISNAQWEESVAEIVPCAKKLAEFKGALGQSSDTLLSALRQYECISKKIELVYTYASLKASQDKGNAEALDMDGRARMAATEAASIISFFETEILSIADKNIESWILSSEYDDYRVYIKKLLRMKPYTLSEKEEHLMALQSESAATADNAFEILTNVDLCFGSVSVKGKEMPLTQTTWSAFMENADRAVREKAYKQFYGIFEQNQHVLAALYAGSVNQDVFEMRSRGYNTCLDKALYRDNVPLSVYHNLIDTVHNNLPALHKFYSLRRIMLGVAELRHYDVYAPLVKDITMNTAYDEAVEICRAALSPLGNEYTDTLCSGLKGGWVDKYENKGKRSGAFSSGAYKGHPYILMNYENSTIRDVFTMAHEGGHSMHTMYSAKSNPYMQYNYTIFEAEVASTFNEELVFEYLLNRANTKEMRIYLLAMRANDILATLYRQTMFAEYELKAHESVEKGIPLSSDSLRAMYHDLLASYFGEEMHFEGNSDMECMRIPHFYNAFYVYKYATGISAALALSERVLHGGKKEKDDYFSFLKSGGSKYPIESLIAAGVDMSSPEPVQAALDKFARIMSELESAITVS